MPATIQAPATRPLDRRSQRRSNNRRSRDGKNPAHSGSDPPPHTSCPTQAGSCVSHARTPAIVADICDHRYRLIADKQAATYQTRLGAIRCQYENELTVLREDVRKLIREEFRRSIRNASLMMHEPKLDVNPTPQEVSAHTEEPITHTASDDDRKVCATMLCSYYPDPIFVELFRAPGTPATLVQTLKLAPTLRGRVKNLHCPTIFMEGLACTPTRCTNPWMTAI